MLFTLAQYLAQVLVILLNTPTLNPSLYFSDLSTNITTTNIIPQAPSNISINNNTLPLYPAPTNSTYSCSLTFTKKTANVPEKW